MILKSSIRGNGLQFADYLANSQKNERTRVLEISGTTNPNDLRESLFEMTVVADLTRSEKPLLQVVINPAIGEGKMMTDNDWKFCQDTVEKHIGFGGQPRGAVEHVYKDEPHVHAFWSRYDAETGKMLPISHIAHKLKAARIEIENELGHEHLLSWQEKKQLAERDLLKSQFSLNLSDIEKKIPEKEPVIEPQPEESSYDKMIRQIAERRERDRGYGY